MPNVLTCPIQRCLDFAMKEKIFITVCERQINFLLGYIKRAVT